MVTDLQIFVALLEECVDVWRPVMAKPIGEGIFLILGEIPSDEIWQFVPGTQVRCEERMFDNGELGLVAVEAIDASPF